MSFMPGEAGCFKIAGLAFGLVCFLAAFGRPETAESGFFSVGQCQGCNLLMISINNIGTEHMSGYGYKRKTVPRIDKWSERAFVFENVFSQASWTLPAATSLFTSLYPYTHNIMDRYRKNLLGADVKTLPEIMKMFGYKTAAFTGGLDYMKIFGHMRGFESVSDNPPFTGFEVAIPQAQKWLSKNSNRKFFLFIQGYNAHPPFTPSRQSKGTFSGEKGKAVKIDTTIALRGYRNTNGKYMAAYYGKPNGHTSRSSVLRADAKEILLTQEDVDYLRDLYDEEILDVDREVGEFLDSLDKNLLDKTVVVIFSEHGEMFAKHGRFGRAGTVRGTLYDDVIHIPLIVKIPRSSGKRLKGLAQLIDVMPTVLEVFGIPLPQHIQGHSLLPLISESKSVNEHVYAGASFNAGRPEPFPLYNIESVNESIRGDRWKLIHEIKFIKREQRASGKDQKETFELYDIQNDFGERNNLAAKYPDIAEDLKRRLRDWVGKARNGNHALPASKEISDEVRERARNNGYW